MKTNQTQFKIDIARDYFRSGNFKEALKIVKSFFYGLTKQEKSDVARAYECYVHEDFYKMLGKDINAEIEKGKKIFREKYL